MTTDLGAGNGKAESVLAGGGKLDGLDLRDVLVLGHGHLNLNRGRGGDGIGVVESSVAETSVAKTVVSESKSVGKDGGNSGGSLGSFLVSRPLPARLSLLEAGHGVTEGVLAAGVDGGVLHDGHGHLHLVHDGLGHGVRVASVAIRIASKTPVGQNNLDKSRLREESEEKKRKKWNLRGGSGKSGKHQQAVHCGRALCSNIFKAISPPYILRRGGAGREVDIAGRDGGNIVPTFSGVEK